MDDRFKWKQRHLDRWGKKKLKYLEEYNQQFVSYLLHEGLLYDYLKDKFENEVENYLIKTEKQWNENFDISPESMEQDWWGYVGRLTNLNHCRDEYIYHNYVMRNITVDEWAWITRAEESI